MRRQLCGYVTIALFAAALIQLPAPPAGAAVKAGKVCTSSSDPALATRIGNGILAARRGRVSAVAVGVDDPGKGLVCWLNGSERFDSASVVKVIILGALLRTALSQHRYLTDTEADLAREMITESDNAAASALWAELGRRSIQGFLDAARMRQTSLGPGGYWGLTQITAHDQVLLLQLLLDHNRVLDNASRRYALSLMADVIPSQRWGVPAGAPDRLTAHVKNGWLPRATHGWRVHSIGCFTGRGGGYSIVVLTDDNPSMSYGISTIEAIARVINRDLNPGARPVVASSMPPAAQRTPDERLPALRNVP
jgi:beta-lactamase class A